MSTPKKPRGYIEKVLFVDVETSGLALGSIDPSRDAVSGTTYQVVSIGLIVASAITLQPIEKLYLEIKWNGESAWSAEAENVHGLSLQYLEANGMSEEDAVVEIATMLLKYWGPSGVVCLAGHNVGTFDKFFFNALMAKHGIQLRFGSKTIDTNSIGFATFGTHNSDDLFELVGCAPRDPAKHNALTDAENALTAVRTIRTLFDRYVN